MIKFSQCSFIGSFFLKDKEFENMGFKSAGQLPLLLCIGTAANHVCQQLLSWYKLSTIADNYFLELNHLQVKHFIILPLHFIRFIFPLF